MLKLTVLDLNTRPANSSDSSAANRRRRSRPCGPTSPAASGRPATGRRLRRDRPLGAWRAWAAVPLLAVTAVAIWPMDAHAQTNAAPVITSPGSKTYEQGETITPFGITVSDADEDAVTVTLSGLPSGLSYGNGQVSGTVSANASAQGYTVTIRADDGVNAAVESTFTVTVTEEIAVGGLTNAPPVITAPGSKTYEQGEAITPFGVTVSDADGDTVAVTVTGLPAGLSYTNGQVQGTVADDAAAQAYTVTIRADDSVNTAVESTFTVTVTVTAAVVEGGPTNTLPVITAPGDKTYVRGEKITPFGVTVSDADGDPLTVTVTGLPSGLSYTNGQVQGTVADDASAEAHTVTIQADDGGDSVATETFTITVRAARAGKNNDQTRPTVEITGPTSVQNGAFTVTISFSEFVTGFEQADVTVGHGTVTGFAGSGGRASVIITPTASGTVTVDVAANVATDGDDNGNTAATRYSVEADLDGPTVSISGPTASQSGSFDVTITFSESVTGFVQGDVTAGNGTVTALTGSGSSYTATITPTASGTATVDVAAGVAVDGAGNGNTAASQLSVYVIFARPEISLQASAYSQNVGYFEVHISFSEPVTGFEQADITVANGHLGPLNEIDAGTFYMVPISPTATGAGTVDVTVDVAANVAVDADGNGNEAAPQLSKSVTFSRPIPLITAPTGVQTGPFDVTITFTESVTGFEKSDITVTGGSVTAFSGSGASYAVTITPTTVKGTVELSVESDVAVDEDGNNNAASFDVRVSVDRFTPSTPTLTRTPFDQPTSPALDVTWSAPGVSGVNITGYEARHRKSGGAWTSYVGILGPSTTKFNLPGLEPGATYEAQVRALDDGVAGRWSATGSGRANSPPYHAPAPPQFPQFSIPWKTDYETPLLGFFNDADGDPFTYSVESLYPGFIEPWISNGSVFVRILNPGTSKILITAYDPYGGVGPKLDGAYFGLAQVTRSVPENSPAGTAVGQPVKGKPYNGVALSHWLRDFASRGDTATSDFVVDAATGQIRVKQGAALDYETKSTYTGRVYWGKVQGRDAFALLTINVTDEDDDDAAPAVTIADVSAAEGDGITFTVRLDKAVSGGLTVTPSFTDGTATKGTDYTENTAGLSFAGTKGETQTFTVSTTDDTDSEPDETFTVGLAVSETTETVTATDTATGTILDDDTAELTIADASSAEGDSMTFTVTLDKAVSGGLTVTPGFTDVSATKGTDYTENAAGIRFAGTAGETQTFTVSTTEDTDREPDETFIVGLTVSGTEETVTATDTATGTVLDDDAASLTIADASAAEGDSMTFTVTLDKAVPGGLTVTPGFTDVTATKGADYTESTTGIRFAGTAGETQTFTVRTTEDTDVEPDETFTVSLTVAGTQTTVTATDTATGTILDDDAPVLTIADASATEGDSMTFTVTLDKAVSGGLTVTPGFTDVTATKGADYTENTAGIRFAGTAGETQTFTVPTTDDTDVESAETFTVGLSVSGTDETVTATDTATGTVLDDDAPGLMIADESAAEGDSMTFTVTLDKAVSGGLTVTPSFTDVTATKGTDYTENTVALSFTGTVGEQHTFTVETTEDDVVEFDETFTVGLTVSGTSETVSASDTATGTVTDDEKGEKGNKATVTMEVVGGEAATEEGESLTFTVTLNQAVQDGLTVTPGFTDVTATKGTDYTENTTGIRFTGTKGETQTFTVATTEDTDVEADETFTVSLAVSNAPDAVTVGDPVTGTITDDDEGGTGADATVTIADAGAAEGESLTFTVTLNQAVQGGLTVTPGFTDVTATKGSDYTENATALVFSGTAGDTKTITVSTTEDTDVEADETFTVSLAVSDAPAGVTVGDPATGTITDDDGGGAGADATVTIGAATAAEGDSLAFTVTLNQAVQGGLTVTPGFTDVTATKGADYAENTAALGFTGTEGETQTFTVGTTEDAVVEEDETFTVSLTVSNAPGGVTVGDPATGTITDDDEGGTGADATVTIEAAGAAEGDSLTFTVTLNQAVQDGLTVTPGFTDVTAAKGTDYSENTAALSFAGTAGETRTFTVATVEDTDVEPDETFTVSLAVSNAPGGVTVGDPATGTITDDDGGGGDRAGGNVTVTIADASASEGDSLTFTVTLNQAVQGGLTVTPGLTDETATSGEDYRAGPPAVRFAGSAGETRTFTVSTVEDDVEEGDETFTVSLAVSGTTATATATDTATGRIVDDDLTPVVLTVDVPRVSETAGSMSVEVTAAFEGGTALSTATAVHVTVGGPGDAAIPGTDYTASPASFTVTIPAGSTEGSSPFTLEPVNDTLMESDEALTVSGESGARPVTGTAVTIEDDDTSSARLVVRLEPATVSESAGPTQVTVVAEIVGATPTVGLPVAMRVGDEGDTARSKVDYEPVDAFTVTIPAGATQQSTTIVLSPIDDDLIEGNETLTLTGEVARLDAASDEGTIRDEDLAEVRSEGTGRTLFLLARAIGSESLAAIEERFSGAGLGRRARLGAAATPGAFAGAGGTFAGAGMPGASPGLPGMAGAGRSGPFAGAGAHGRGALGMGPGMGPAMAAQQHPFAAKFPGLADTPLLG